jgi:hypothetical protein
MTPREMKHFSKSGTLKHWIPPLASGPEVIFRWVFMEISTQVKNQANQSEPFSRLRKIFFRNTGRLTKGFLLILAATLVASTIILWLDGRPKPLRQYFYTGLFSLVYSSCIGGTLILGLNLFLPKIIAQGFWIKILFLALLIFVSTFIGLFSGGFVLLALGIFPASQYLSSALDNWRISLFMGVLFGTFAFLSDSLKLRLEKTELELRTWQLAEERSRSLAAEARLSSLESRVRPHFLFNALNSISALNWRRTGKSGKKHRTPSAPAAFFARRGKSKNRNFASRNESHSGLPRNRKNAFWRSLEIFNHNSRGSFGMPNTSVYSSDIGGK